MKKIHFRLILILVITAMIHVPCIAANGVVEAYVNTVVAGDCIQVFIKANPNTAVSIEILYPNSSLPATNNSATLKNVFAYAGQVVTDVEGTAQINYSIGEETGVYTVRANGSDVSILSRTSVSKDDFFAVAWSSGYELDNVFPMFWLSKSDLNTYGAQGVAQKAKAALDLIPEGKRAIMIHSFLGELNMVLTQNSENYIWWDDGVTQLKNYITDFFAAYYAIGGKVDFIVGDLELGMTNWDLSQGAVSPQDKLKQIENDPRYSIEIRPLLAERGFQFNTDPEKGELYEVYKYLLDNVVISNNYNIWNSIMNSRKADYLNESIYFPAREYYPNIRYSNYNSRDRNSWYRYPESHGHKIYLGGNEKKAGTHSSLSAYGGLGQLKLFPPEEYYGNDFNVTPFNGLLYTSNYIRAMMLSDTGAKIQPWITRYNIDTSTFPSTLLNNPYYFENVIHIGMCNPDPFMFYGPRYSASENSIMIEEQANILSGILDELNEVVGFTDRRTLITELSSWNDKFILSGMYAAGRNVWRITPDLSEEGMNVENFCINTDTPTFEIGGKTITFPGGRIYMPVAKASQYGYWVETPADVYPVISYNSLASYPYEFKANLDIYRANDGIAAEKIPNQGGMVARLSYHNESLNEKKLFFVMAEYAGNILNNVKIISNETIAVGKDSIIVKEFAQTSSNITRVAFFVCDEESLSPIMPSYNLIR